MPRPRLLRILALAALLAGSSASRAQVPGDAPPEAREPVATPLTAFEGRVVRHLGFRGDASVDEATLAALTDLGPGKVLTRGALRTALRDLFATRRFADLWIEGREADDGGVDVVVAFVAATRVHALTVPPLPGRRELLDILGVSVGDPWEVGFDADVERNTRRFLRSQGYFRAAVAVRVEAGPDASSVDVTLDVRPGPRTLAASPQVKGVLGPLAEGTFLKALKLRPGKPFRESVARADAERLLELLRKAGHLRAEVVYEDADFDEKTGQASARYRVAAGPRIVVTVEGASASLVMGHAEAPWARADVADEEGLRRLAVAVRRTLQESGFYRAKVDVAIATSASGEEAVTYRVVKGRRMAIARVFVDGVRSIRRGDVTRLLATRARGVLETGRLVDERLAADREAIAGLYRSRGYASVTVSPPGVEDGPTPGTLAVTFRVDEGPRVTVSEVSFTGVSVLQAEDLAALVHIKRGDVLSPGSIADDADRLREAYLRKGFGDVRVEVATSLATPVNEGARAEASLRFDVVEGAAETFGKTIVRGNRKTRLSLIARELAHREGEPFMLSSLLATQQRLSRLGVFSRVELGTLPKDPSRTSRTVLLTVAEAKPWSLTYGLGAEYDERQGGFNLKPRVSFGVGYGNLFGSAVSLGLDARYTPRETRLILSLRAPALVDARTPFSLTAFRTKESRTIDVDRLGSYLEAERRLSSRLKGALRLQYEIVESDADPLALSASERLDQKIDIASIGPGFLFDSRDDITNPRSGLFFSTDVKYAFPFLGATASFWKGFGQAFGYQKLGSTTLALAVRAGAIEPQGGCTAATNPTCAPNLEIPVAERFFAGGRSTHRAFAQDELAVEGETRLTLPDRTVYVGGNGLFVFNVELRVPVRGDLGVSLFFDAGNVWADYRNVSLSQLRTGIGGGVHYLTPVGPVRLEYGWKLKRQPGESPGELSFSIGFPF